MEPQVHGLVDGESQSNLEPVQEPVQEPVVEPVVEPAWATALMT